MTPNTETTQLKIDVGIIKDQMSTTRDVIDRIEKKIDGMKYATTEDLAAVIKMLDDYKREVKETYTTKEAFDPIKRVVYGLIGLILVGVGAALLGLVIR